ncbi:hypothetical protein QQS21_006298 [Conoideocrella luteorostrata]|uniref:Xylanolytic transcriptional activator regulatory domain-containing protein n=1 Tax=Conoideocrella luteorostrata TaxID=1105319 RepID=A0AAJ0FT20_9HYPO|nr:hypothetical protein QQS21_006298 [Conoideocrella luteorostrata]
MRAKSKTIAVIANCCATRSNATACDPPAKHAKFSNAPASTSDKQTTDPGHLHADAVPKKRGPKTDVLEALLKRVDGLEAKLKEKPSEGEPSKVDESATEEVDDDEAADVTEPTPKRVAIETNKSSEGEGSLRAADQKPNSRDNLASPVETDAFLHTYFARFHGKPYYILDESSIRQRIQLNQLPDCLSYAIWAVASRHTPHPNGPQAAVQLSEDYEIRARGCIDTDEPSIDYLQTLLLLVTAFTASGQGKKAYMLMSLAIGMAIALELHREIDALAQVTPIDRELRRRLFWTCYLLDRYLACGSKRPSLISDSSIALRLPSWCPSQSPLAVDGEFFQQASSLQYYQGSGKKSQGSTGMLIDITRVLGITNRYLAAGGVKGDSHFPWHSLSTLSKIRQELDFWASGAGPIFSGLHALFRQTEATIVFLSKLIYHLIHCLVYRPFLPIDLAELAGNGQHQSWQIEATSMCFLHANAIGELIDAARQAGTVEWPAIVGYCICTAATVHIHGAHYTNPSAYGGDASVLSASSDLLSREMQRLNELHFSWANVQHQSNTLQGIYSAHGELVQAVASNSMRYTPGFHLEDFFDRYTNIGGPGGKSYRFDPAHLSMSDVVVDFTAARYSDSPAAREAAAAERHSYKRKNTSSHKKKPDLRNVSEQEQAARMGQAPGSGGVSYPMNVMQGRQQAAQGSMQQQVTRSSDNSSGGVSIETTPTIQSYSMPSVNQAGNFSQGLMLMSGAGFSPAFGYTPSSNMHSMQGDLTETDSSSYDPMFGLLPTNAFGSPAGWQVDSGNQQSGVNMPSHTGMAPSPETKSASGSTGTGKSDEKDPFLSLLEQLAENEQSFAGVGTNVDFFLGADTHGA